MGNKTGATRLGFVVLLKSFQREGRFPLFKNEIPVIERAQAQPPNRPARKTGGGSSVVEGRKVQLAQACRIGNRGDRGDFAVPDREIEDAEQPPLRGHDDSH